MKAFLKKEWMEWLRTGRMAVLFLVFLLLGIMNPAFAKLTPWLMEAMSGSLADSGIIIEAVTVDAMDSWAQFYKNIPMGLIIFLLLCSGSFTGEYQKGTLVPVVAKGLSRRKVLAAKSLFLAGAWCVLYMLCFGVTYGYNAYFWDNGIASHLLFAAACYLLFGIWAVASLVLCSTVADSSPQALLGAGGAVLAAYLLGLFPKLAPYVPARLMEGLSLLQGGYAPEDFYGGIAVTVGMAALCMAVGAVCFERKRL